MKSNYYLILLLFVFNFGFSSEITKPLALSATITGGTTVCQNASNVLVTFTGSGGTAPYTFVYKKDNGENESIPTIGGNSSVTVSIPTNLIGTFIYSLISVKESIGEPINVIATTTFIVSTPPIVDFTFTNDSTCSGTSLQFTSTVTESGSATYSWDFGDGTAVSTSANPTHKFEAVGCGNQNFSVKLTVVKNGCTETKTKTVVVKQKPLLNFTDVLNPFSPELFSNCMGTSAYDNYTIIVGNNSSSCATSFLVNWGDGNTESNVSFPLSHTYTAVGVYSMTITATGTNGCVNTKTYQVKNISNPLGGLNSPGSTQNLCAPTTNLQFSISNWGTNSLDTTYNVSYGDGATLFLTQAQLISSTYYNATTPENSANYPIPHIYTTSNCPAPSYQVTLDVTNACGTTPFTLGNISILTKAITNFTSLAKACVNTSILFTNTTTGGLSQGCSQLSIFTWNFGDGSPLVTTQLTSPQNISHTYTAPGVYTVTLTSQNICGISTKTQQICIEPPLIPLFTLNTNSGCAPLSITTTNSTVLTNQCDTPTYKWEVTHSAGFCNTTNPTFPNQTTANASYNFTEAGTYTLKLTTTNKCGSTTTNQTIVVKKPPTVSINPIATFCGPGSITPSAIVNSCSPAPSTLTYVWNFPGGTPATATTANPGSISYSTPGVKNITLIVSNECGPSNTVTQSFTVNPTPTITNTDLSQTVCSGTMTTPVILTTTPTGAGLTWTAVASAGISGFTATGTGSTIPAQTLTTTNANSGTVTYTITPKIGDCTGTTLTYVITVNPAPIITSQPIQSSVCLNGLATPLTVAINSNSGVPTYQWYSNITSSTTGGAAISGATSATFNPPTNVVGELYYYCKITLPPGGCAGLTSASALVKVVALPVISTQPLTSQNICVGTVIANPLSVTASGGLGTVSYQWYSNNSAATTGGSAINGATSAIYTPPIFTTVGTFYYYVTVTFSGNNCGNVSSQPAVINVFADPIITSQPIASQTLCSNAIPTNLVVVAAGGNGTFSYQWFSNNANSITGGTLIANATNASYTPPTATVGTKYYYCVITQNTLGCGVTSATAQVIIKQSPTATILPTSNTSCIGGTPNVLTVTTLNGVGTPTYQWYSSTTDDNTTGLAIPGQITSTFLPPATIVGVTFYYCKVTFADIAGSCSTVATNTSRVEIIPAAIVSIEPNVSQNLCVGVTISIPLSVSYTGGTGTPSYEWFKNTTNSNSGGIAVASSNFSTYTPPIFNTAGTYYYYAEVSLSGSGCGAVKSPVVEIIVSADPTVSTQPLSTQTLCTNAIPTNLVVVAAGGNGTFSYQWFSNTANNNTLGTSIPGATNANYTPPTNSVGTVYYYCLIKQSILGCDVTSNTAAVIINQSPSATITPISNISCIGGTPNTLTVAVVNGIGTPTYEWYSSTTDDNTTGLAIPGQITSTFLPPATIVGVTFYYCKVTFTDIAGSCSTVTTNTSRVEIIPAAIVSIEPNVSQNLCVGVTISIPLSVSYTGGTGTPSYEWFKNTTNSNSGGIAVASSNFSTYTPPIFNTAGTYYYYAEVSLSGSGCGAVSSAVVQIIVSEDPTITQPIATQTLCSNATPADLVVVAAGGNGSFNYQWYSNTLNSTTGGASISNATNASYTPPTNEVGIIYYYCEITQSTLGCSVISATSAVIVNQSPSALILPTSSTACIGGNPSTLSLIINNGVGTPTYQWYSNTTSDPATATLLVGETNNTFTPPATAVGSLLYYCSVTFSGITGSCATVQTNASEIIITAAPTINQNPLVSQALCVGATIPNPLTVSYTGGNGDPSYQWYSNSSSDTSTGTAIPGATAENFTPPVFNTAETFYFYVEITLAGNGCGAIKSAAAEIIIVNDPTINVQPLPLQTLCQNAIPTALSVTPLGGIGIQYFYQWYSSVTNITTGGTLISGATSSSFVPPTDIVGTMFYFCVVNQQAGSGCNVTSAAAQVITNTAPAINLQPQGNIYCVNQTAIPLTVNYINGTGTPTYQWFSSVTNTNSGELLLVGQTNNSLTPSTTIAENLYYYCVITFSELVGGCEIITSDTALITVNPFAIIASENATICSNNTFSILPTDGNGNVIPTGTTYTWSQPTINPAGALTGFSAQIIPQTEISQLLINTTTNPATITYTVTPTSGICIGTDFTVTITVNPSINPNVVVSNNDCFGVNNASISTNITGGIPPYSISWLGPNGFTSSATTISNIEPGTYTITIDDIGNCPFTESYTITQPDDIVIITNSQTNSTCFQSNDATIDVSVTGGTGDYTYYWTKNNVFFASTQDLSDLSPGIYIVTVSDENNCGPKTQTFTITEPPLLVVSLANQININCFGDSTGAINVDVIGGTNTNPYVFSWTGPNGFSNTNQNLSAIPVGTYNLIVSDNNGCQKTLEVTLTESTEILIAFTTTEITCYGANDASLTTTISGGNAPYTFTWNNLSTALNQNNLSAGDYIITVTDNLGCIKTATINIPEAPIFTVNPLVKNVSCFGANNGSIALNLIGGIAPVTLTWSDGSTAGLTRNNLTPGTYTATINDGKPCQIIRTFIIVQPQPLILSANITNPTNCLNANSGIIDLIVSGGTAPFSYSWSNGSTSEDLNNLMEGNYAVTVVDANGCSVSGQYSLVRPEPILIKVITQTDFDCSSHKVTQNFIAEASGGIPPFTYQWSSGSVSGANNQIMNSQTNGTVILTVFDSLGCSQIYTVTVDNPVIGYASFDSSSTSYTSFGFYSINDALQFTSNITGDYQSMYWDFGDGTFSSELNPTHVYTIEKEYLVTQTVTYPFGCEYKYNATLSVEKGYVLVVPTGFSPNSDSINDKFRPVTKNLTNIVMDIYDSWGSLIYSEKGDVIKGWDGKIKGFNAENGNYYSKVAAKTFYGTIVYENQTFVLIK